MVSEQKRGRQSPSWPLKEAIGWMEAINRALGYGPFSRDSIAQALGHKAGSGTGKTKVGTLSHFSLLQKSGGAYPASAIAEAILATTTEQVRAIALANAAKGPLPYKELRKAFSDCPMPARLCNILA